MYNAKDDHTQKYYQQTRVTRIRLSALNGNDQ